ncbi:MAG: hypothetical protein FJY95_06335 [Candidatus Handelsmanbacteria bacterium]|nr:hypothetical protein [Candidatus Handelsmanbacteria bacterium]
MIRLALLVLFLAGCGGGGDPLEDLVEDLNRHPEYSVIVEDLREEEGFFPDYFVRFRVLAASGAGGDSLRWEERLSEEYQVGEEVYGRYENYLGMVVAAKNPDGRRSGPGQAHPPGYQYVDNPRYGFWDGGGFWQFYGQYMLLSQLLGGWQINRSDYGDYRRNYERGQPYAGPNAGGRTPFGTGGTTVERSRPEFFKRYQERLGSPQFRERVQSRMGRGGSSWGSGSVRAGK